MNTNEKFLLKIEDKFKRTCKIEKDISSFPLRKNIINVATNKDKSKEFSEVFTPLWLVDKMIKQVDFESCNTTTLDLCAGYGQFSIRLMRYFYNHFPYWDLKKFVKNTHAFSELQLSSCYKLLNIFGNSITLFIGDSTHLNKLPVNARGLWCYIESYGYWVCLTKTIQKILSPNGIKEKPCSEQTFVSSIESIVNGLNETHTAMKEKYNLTASQLTPEIRLDIINEINNLVRDNGDTVVKVIPPNLVSDMLDQVEDLEKKTILVLYNCEIIEQLITKKKIKPEQITFGSDFNGMFKSEIMKKMYGVETINFTSSKDFPKLLHSEFKGRKFDVCLSNPPYNRNLDLKILQALMDKGTIETSLAKEFIWVHPSTWLLDQKDKSALYLSLKNNITKKLKGVKFFNGNAVFDIELFSPCVITHIDLEHDSNKIKVSFFKENFIADGISNITKFGSSWNPIVKPFRLLIKEAIKTQGNVWDHNVRTLIPNKSYCQLAAIIGNHSKDADVMIKDDFYTMTIKNSSANKGVRETRLNKPGGKTPTFEFNSDIERDNFLTYLNTDFARFCLALYKIGQHLENGELEIVPWLDFTQTWDDYKLFNHFDINKDTQDYIRKFLPDYYGIRK